MREYRLLGPLEARLGGAPVPLGGPKQRAVLALLLLEAGRVVPQDRLVEELWGSSPPETASTSLHGYVSQLRKVLEPEHAPGSDHDVLRTRPPGYLLEPGPGELDLDRFRALTGEGARHLESGDAGSAARSLAEALRLWRGPPLADLTGEPWAPDAIRRLEEERLRTEELRFDAELALGHHAELVPELEAAVAREPLRERLRGQLMLALYRSGRQADALEAFRSGRRLLVDELGLEPGAELRAFETGILTHDPALAGPASSPAAGREEADGHPLRRRARAGPRRAALIGLAVAVLAAAVVAALGTGDDAPPVRATPDSVAVIDPATARVTASIPVGSTPTRVSVGEGAAWVLNADDQTISRIDARTRAVTTFSTGSTPTDLVAGADGVWVGHHTRIPGAQYVGPAATGVLRVDPDSRIVRTRVRLPRRPGRLSNVTDSHFAVGGGAVWGIAPDSAVVRIDPVDERVTGRTRDVQAVAIAAAGDQVWALEHGNTIARIDPRTMRALRRITVPGEALTGIALGAGSVWVTDPGQGTLWRVDPRPTPVLRTIPVGSGAAPLAFGAGAVWVGDTLTGHVVRVDPARNAVTARIPVGGTPLGLTVGARRVWVTLGATAAGVGAGPATLASGGRRGQTCGRTFTGAGGPPDAVIVSDLPLRAAPEAPTLQMSQAIAFVLRDRGFRAGRLRIGYRSCDDSTAQTRIFDGAKCAANAGAYVRDRAVLGVVGPYNSGCAFELLAVAGKARGGPLPVVGPTTSDPHLTRDSAAVPPSALAAIRAGRAGFVRVFPRDDQQGAADALLARRLGARRVFIATDGEPGYGGALAGWFRRAARRLGLELVGEERWRPDRRSREALARRIRSSGAEAVFLAGLLDTGGGDVLRTLHRRLGSRVRLIAPDGFLPVSSLFATAGPAAARAVWLSRLGVPAERLTERGRRFVAEFGAGQPQRQVDPAAIYAAQATEVLLDAIGRSDGTRRSVVAQLRAGRERDGLIGRFAFDGHGDVMPAPVTIARPREPGGSPRLQSLDGARVVDVIAPPERLTR